MNLITEIEIFENSTRQKPANHQWPRISLSLSHYINVLNFTQRNVEFHDDVDQCTTLPPLSLSKF